MTTVYVLTEGQYSDYSIVGVFLDKNLAELAKAARPESSIEEYEADQAEPEIRQGMRFWKVYMDRNGNSDEPTQRAPLSDWEVKQPTDHRIQPDYPWLNFTDCWQFQVWARSEQHAVKIANERRAALIASGQWDGTGVAP